MGRRFRIQGQEQEMALERLGDPCHFGDRSRCRSRCWVRFVLTVDRDNADLASLTRNKSASNTSSGSSGSGASTTDANGSTVAASKTASSTAAAPSATPTSGGMGSLITMENGETFTYDNALGGTWHWDEADPFNVSCLHQVSVKANGPDRMTPGPTRGLPSFRKSGSGVRTACLASTLEAGSSAYLDPPSQSTKLTCQH